MAFSAQAQPGKRMERIHAIKVAYLTDKLQLTSEQSEKFWPIYNRYEEERFATVSYTHLDVYKRQLLVMSQGSV